jgi:sugar transferase (PEP-CTERM system associated)
LGLFSNGSMVRNKLILLGGDTLAGFIVLILLLIPETQTIDLPLWACFFIPSILVCSFLCEVYQPEKWIFRKRLLHSLLANVCSFFILLIFLFIGTGSFLKIVGFQFLFLVLQNSWQIIFQVSQDSLFFAQNIITIGTGANAKNVEELITASPNRYVLSGYIGTPMDPVTVDEDKIIGGIDDIIELAKKYKAHAIVIALTERRKNLQASKLVTCKLMGVRILDYPSFFELMTGKIPVEDINPSWLMQSSGFLITPFIRLLKRILDIICASILLLVCLPFFPVVALCIKLDSRGPIFYSQKRVGLNNINFTIYKLRSMGLNAEKNSGASWAQKNDPRVTPVGTFIRRTRIDELPQLINVLKGDMSFIGPRPERPEFVRQISQLTPYYLARHAIKPGITGWAQVKYPYGSSFGDSVEKLRYDLYYINNLSLFLELFIIFKTIKTVLLGKGGR